MNERCLHCGDDDLHSAQLAGRSATSCGNCCAVWPNEPFHDPYAPVMAECMEVFDARRSTPAGKTRAIITQPVAQTMFKNGDTGYIDGYVRCGDDRPAAVFVRDDGIIDFVPTYAIVREIVGITAPKPAFDRTQDPDWLDEKANADGLMPLPAPAS